jgi:penicillin amidase
LALKHPLVNVPLIGSKYRFDDLPIGGSTDTLMKTSHGLVDGRHETSYGSQARFLTDLGDPDANWFALLGGQDGWINSGAFLDQVPLWLTGDYVQVPLTEEKVREAFPGTMTLRPVTGSIAAGG